MTGSGSPSTKAAAWGDPDSVCPDLAPERSGIDQESGAASGSPIASRVETGKDVSPVRGTGDRRWIRSKHLPEKPSMPGESLPSVLPMRAVEVTVFGGLEVKVSGRDVPIGPATKFTVALLAIASEAGLSSAVLRDLLWESGTDAQLRGRLNQRLHDLRSSVGLRDCVVYASGRYRLSREHVRSDVEAFELALRDGSLDLAAQLVTSGLLKGLNLEETPSAARWIKDRQSELRAKVEDAANRAWDEAVRVGDWVAAEDAAYALARLEPEEDGNLARLVKVLSRTSRDQDGSSQVTALPSSSLLELVPADRVERLLQLEQESERALAASIRSKAGGHALVGRSAELTEIRAALAADSRSTPVCIVVHGAPGAGKTRLCDEALSQVSRSGTRVWRIVGARERQRIQFSCLWEALTPKWVRDIASSSLETHHRRCLLNSGLLSTSGGASSLAPSGGTLSAPPGLQGRTVHQSLSLAANALAGKLKQDRSLVLFVDGADLLDDETEALLAGMLADSELADFHVILTVTGSRCPDWIQVSEKTRHLHSLHVGLLGTEETWSLAVALSSGRLDSRRLATSVRISGGNPGVLTEIIAGLMTDISREQLVSSSGFPERLLTRLPRPSLGGGDEACVVICALALSPCPMSPGQLASVCGISANAVQRMLLNWSRDGLIQSHQTAVSPASEFVRRIGLASLPNETSKYLANRVLECLSESDCESSLYSLIDHARCALVAGQDHVTSSLLERVAREAESPTEHSHCLELIEELSSLTGRASSRLHSFGFRLGMSLDWPLDARRQAQQWLMKAHEAGHSRGSIAAQLATIRASYLAGSGELGELKRACRRLREAEIDTSWGELLADSLDLEVRLSDSSLAGQSAREILDATIRILKIHGLQVETRARLCHVAGLGALFGMTEQAVEHLKEGVALANSLGREDLALMCLARLLLVHVHLGTLATGEGERVVQTILRGPLETGDALTQLYVRMNLAVWDTDTWRPESAIPKLESCLKKFGGRVPSRARGYVHINLATAHCRTGEMRSCASHLKKAGTSFGTACSSAAREVSVSLAGLTALHRGDFQTLRQAIEDLEAFPLEKSMDPTLAVDLLCRWYWHQRKQRELGSLIDRALERTFEALPVHFLTIVRTTVPYLEYLRRPRLAAELIASAEEKALSLSLPWMAAQIKSLRRASHSM